MMTSSFQYSTRYKLDSSHFRETFEESGAGNVSLSAYFKAVFLVLVGLSILALTDILPYAAWFIIVLGIVDALSVYFRKPWWLARQMLSMDANIELSLTIDDKGISSQSSRLNSQILWTDVSDIQKSNRGWLIQHTAGKTYLSSKHLSDEAIAFVDEKMSSSSAN
jgi:hypothetical protein